MRRSPLALAMLLAAAALVAGGCFSKKPAEKQRYLLDAPLASTSGRQAAPTVASSVKLDRVRVSPLYDSKGFVYRTGPKRYETEFYHEFYASPAAVFEEVLFQWLRSARTFEVVRAAQDPEPATWRLAVRIDEVFFADVTDRGAPQAVLSMSVELRDTRRREQAIMLSRHYSAAIPINGAGAGEVLDGWSAALAQILPELDADLRRAAR